MKHHFTRLSSIVKDTLSETPRRFKSLDEAYVGPLLYKFLLLVIRLAFGSSKFILHVVRSAQCTSIR